MSVVNLVNFRRNLTDNSFSYLSMHINHYLFCRVYTTHNMNLMELTLQFASTFFAAYKFMIVIHTIEQEKLLKILLLKLMSFLFSE